MNKTDERDLLLALAATGLAFAVFILISSFPQ
jgi:hypothetical protein